MPAQNYNVFISYSRANQDQKKRLLTHLDSLAFDGTIAKPWHDRLIGAGDVWRSELETAMNEAEVGLLLISADFIASAFCQDVEVPRMLERHQNDGVLIIPIIVGHCSWKHIPWLSQFQVLPEDGKPVTSQLPRDKAWTQVIEGLRWQLENKPPHKKLRVVGAAKSDQETQLFSLNRLLQTMPGETGDLFGREDALGWLDDAYSNPQVSVLALVGFGGVGKSALVRHWLETRFSECDMGLPRFLGVSFYSQGTREQEAGSSDQFLIQSLQILGEEGIVQKSAWDRGERLAELLGEKPTVLILDGLEPLQHGPGLHNLEGQLKDPGVHALLAHLAEHPGKVLSVVSTRVPLTDSDLQSTSFVQKSVETLSPEAARDLMLARGVRGTEAEINKAGEYLGHHPLALVMASEYLQTFAEGDVNRLAEIPLLSEQTREGRHAKSVMAAYEKALKTDGDPLDVELLGILGLFDRPTKWEWLKALSTRPPIKNVTDHIVVATDRELWESISRLRQWGMLADPGSLEDPLLEAHPLIREYFGEKLKDQNKKGWKAAHSKMFNYLNSTTQKFPDNLEEMEPLYQAIVHGCAADRHNEAFDAVYASRIHRGTQYFSIKKLGAYGSDLNALRSFFDAPWQHPVVSLSQSAKAYVLGAAGFILMAIGQAQEAIPPLRACMEAYLSKKVWESAAVVAGNLSEAYLALGELSQSLEYAQQSVIFADGSSDSFQQMSKRTGLANTLNQLGRLSEAEEVFREAEVMQKNRKTQFSILFSLWGYRYCELLLDQGKYQEVQVRVDETLAWAMSQGLLLTIANDCLSMGRAYLLQAQREATGHLAEATGYLQRALAGLRHAGSLYRLPSGLLARGELYRISANFRQAFDDVDEAMRIATRGKMGLHQADCHLEYARLYLAMSEKTNESANQQENKVKAREHWNTAKEMIERMGYHRRDKEVGEIEAQLNRA